MTKLLSKIRKISSSADACRGKFVQFNNGSSTSSGILCAPPNPQSPTAVWYFRFSPSWSLISDIDMTRSSCLQWDDTEFEIEFNKPVTERSASFPAGCVGLFGATIVALSHPGSQYDLTTGEVTHFSNYEVEWFQHWKIIERIGNQQNVLFDSAELWAAKR